MNNAFHSLRTSQARSSRQSRWTTPSRATATCTRPSRPASCRPNGKPNGKTSGSRSCPTTSQRTTATARTRSRCKTRSNATHVRFIVECVFFAYILAARSECIHYESVTTRRRLALSDSSVLGLASLVTAEVIGNRVQTRVNMYLYRALVPKHTSRMMPTWWL